MRRRVRMRLATTKDIAELRKMILDYDPEVLIVEGHDGAGKGRVIKDLVLNLGIKVYRPDYRYWNDHVTTKKRWVISRAFFDLIPLVGLKEKLIIDHCMISGAVYEEDLQIAKDMAELCKKTRILHVLVTANRDDYYKMQGVRLGTDRVKS